MLANGNSLLDEVVKIFTEIGGSAHSFHNSEDLASSDKSNLGHTMRISKDNTYTYNTKNMLDDGYIQSSGKTI